MEKNNNITAKGYCSKCKKEHTLGEGNARKYCLELMEQLGKEKRIDLTVGREEADPKLSTEYLFGKARGQMFGVLEAEDEYGSVVILKAFSGQYNGIWHVNGWVTPLLNPLEFDNLISEEDKMIKMLGREIDQLPCTSDKRAYLVNERRQRSQKLQQEIFALYRLNNFKGKSSSIFEAYTGDNGIPTGTGDCCAPKLLNYAAVNNLKPVGIAEFYWGMENLSGTREHGKFYPSCEDKCYSILGYMLCGLDE